MNRLYLRLKRHWLNLNTTIEVKNCFIFMTFSKFFFKRFLLNRFWRKREFKRSLRFRKCFSSFFWKTLKSEHMWCLSKSILQISSSQKFATIIPNQFPLHFFWQSILFTCSIFCLCEFYKSKKQKQEQNPFTKSTIDGKILTLWNWSLKPTGAN